MVSLLKEKRQSLTELAQEESVDISTVWRWANRGIGGVKLETFLRGGRRFTTAEAFERFCEARTLSQGIDVQRPATKRQRDAEHERDLNVLEKMGV